MNEIRVRELNEGPFKAAVLEAISQIPQGRVASYEDVAEAIGYPKEAGILVGWVVDGTRPDDAPIHRVTRADGTIPKRGRVHPLEVANKLSAEGVEVLEGPTVDLELYRWQPDLKTRLRGPIHSGR